jgi:hypothetical protein
MISCFMVISMLEESSKDFSISMSIQKISGTYQKTNRQIWNKNRWIWDKIGWMLKITVTKLRMGRYLLIVNHDCDNSTHTPPPSSAAQSEQSGIFFIPNCLVQVWELQWGFSCLHFGGIFGKWGVSGSVSIQVLCWYLVM